MYMHPVTSTDHEVNGNGKFGVTSSALTTNFHILVSRGGGWFGISRTIKF